MKSILAFCNSYPLIKNFYPWKGLRTHLLRYWKSALNESASFLYYQLQNNFFLGWEIACEKSKLTNVRNVCQLCCYHWSKRHLRFPYLKRVVHFKQRNLRLIIFTDVPCILMLSNLLFLSNWCIIRFIHSFSSLSYDRSKASSKASSLHSAI